MNIPFNGMFSSGPPADYLIIFAFPIGDALNLNRLTAAICVWEPPIS